MEVADGHGGRQARIEQIRPKLRRSKQGLKGKARGFKEVWWSLQECKGGLEHSLLGPYWLWLLTPSHLGYSRPDFCISFDLGLGRLGESFWDSPKAYSEGKGTYLEDPQGTIFIEGYIEYLLSKECFAMQDMVAGTSW